MEDLYLVRKHSVREIGAVLKCSQNRVNYWLKKFSIPKRHISEALYTWHNPDGDPFLFTSPVSLEDYFLWGLGLGLYWGEGTRRNKVSVRLGNSDPALLKTFLTFLDKVYGIQKKKLRFSIVIFHDVTPQTALNFWSKQLGVHKKQFQRPVVISLRRRGTYKHRAPYGVATLYFNNRKLRDLICADIEKLQRVPYNRFVLQKQKPM